MKPRHHSQRNIKKFLIFIVLGLVVFVFYGNTLKNGFVLDDLPQIVENPYVHSLSYLPKVITGCIWESDLGSCKGNAIHYRPIQNLSFLLSWQISSHPWFFHLITVFYFFIAASLVFIFTKLLSKNFFVSFLTTLFFIIHPINNEVANWISAVPEITLVIFALLSFIFYLKYQENRFSRHLIFVYLFYFFAILAKELAIFIIPLVILVIDLVILELPIKKILRKEEIKRYLYFSIPIIVYLFMRVSALGGLGKLASGGGSFYGLSFSERIPAFFSLFTFYLKELLFPYPMIFFHEFPISPNLGNLFFLISLTIFSIFGLFFFLALKNKKRLITFALAWIFCFSLPTLIFFNFSGKNVFFDRYLTGVSIGFCFLLASFLNYAWTIKEITSKKRELSLRYLLNHLSPKSRRLIVSFFVALLMIICFSVVYSRNEVWQDNLTLVRNDIAFNPDAYYANSLREFLAKLFLRQGNLDEAIKTYEEMINLNIAGYDLGHIYDSLAEFSLIKNDTEKAERYYKKAIELSAGKDFLALRELGELYQKKEDYLKAVIMFCRAFVINQQDEELQSNAGLVYNVLSNTTSDDLFLLYNNITSGQVFQKAPEGEIRLKEENCLDKNCLLSFSTSFSKGEIVLPFLIMGQTKSGEVFRPIDLSFDQEKSEIHLKVSIDYKDKPAIFIFPTCTGSYYEVTTSSKQ